jgi:hypothetical protein
MRWIHIHPQMRFCFLLLVVCAVALGLVATGQQAQDQQTVSTHSDALADSVRELQQEVRDLRLSMQEMQSQTEKYRQETLTLRRELGEARAAKPSTTLVEENSLGYAPNPRPSPVSAVVQDNATSQSSTGNDDRTARLDEEYQLLTGKVDEQYQTKVESWSKYRIRFSGIVLFNLFSNTGSVDNADIPSLALPSAPGASGGSFGGTLRQSQLGFAVTGPSFAGARTSADIRFDFGGGFSGVPNGVNYGLAWLRTGTVRLDWANTSVIAGQDGLFFSPLSPTSFASQSIPALAYAGNLWSWTPQVRVEHRIALSNDSSFVTQFGILDNLDGEPPATSAYRVPQAGESSRQPAYATRVAWSRTIFGQPLTIGAAGYYGRQNYGFNRNVDAWAGMTDANLPLSRMFALSGKFYRGRAVGGLSGGLGTSVLVSGDLTTASTTVQGLNSAGGWAQFKFQPRSTLEFNVAYGEDNPLAGVPYLPNGGTYAVYLARNQGSLANVIFRPRSDLLFSAEYHYLKTFSIGAPDNTASQVNLIMGVLF